MDLDDTSQPMTSEPAALEESMISPKEINYPQGASGHSEVVEHPSPQPRTAHFAHTNQVDAEPSTGNQPPSAVQIEPGSDYELP